MKLNVLYIVIITLSFAFNGCTGGQRTTYFVVNDWVVDEFYLLKYGSQEHFESFNAQMNPLKEDARFNFRQNNQYSISFDGKESKGEYGITENGQVLYFKDTDPVFDSLYIMEIGNEVLFLETSKDSIPLIMKLVPNEKLY